MHNFRELKIWQRSRELVKEMYKLTRKFPDEELYILTREIRRTAISIPSNIAEGCGRNSNKELSRFLDIANGSAFELETQLFLAIDLEYLNSDESEKWINEINEIEKMIFSLKQSIL